MNEEESRRSPLALPRRDPTVLRFPSEGLPQSSELEAPFAALFSRMYERAYHFAAVELRDDENARLLVQDVFVALWHTHFRLHEAATDDHDAVAFRMVRFRLSNFRREAQSGTRRRLSALRRGVRRWLILSDAIHHDELASVVDGALRDMTPRAREIFILKRESGMSYSQIAAISGSTVDVVRVLMHRAQLALREHMENAGFGSRSRRRMVERVGQRGSDVFVEDAGDKREEREALLERELNPEFFLLSDYVCGELSDDRAADVRARIERDREFRDLAEPLLVAWSINSMRAPLAQDDLLRAWLQIRRRAGMPQVAGQDAVDRDELRALYTREQLARRAQVRRRTLIAAGVLILVVGAPLGATWIARNVGPVTHSSEPWQSASVQLPEGSRVTLGSGSTITRPRQFANPRSLELVGEARFDVSAGPAPFTVRTEAAEAWALGTSFTVTAYEGAATVIVVHEGTVRVRSLFDDPSLLRIAIDLTAGQSARVVRNAMPERIR